MSPFIDNSSAREASLRVELSQANAQLSLLPSLRQRFDALVKDHAGSKERHSASVTAYRAQVADLEMKLRTGHNDVARLGAEGIAKTREVGRLGDELGRLRVAIGDVEDKLSRKAEECRQETKRREEVEAEMEFRKQTYERHEAMSRRQFEQLSAQSSAYIASAARKQEAVVANLKLQSLIASHQVLRLQRKAAEKQDQVAQLVELVMILEEEKIFAELRAEDLEDQLEDMSARSRIEQARGDRASEVHKGLLLDARRQLLEHSEERACTEREARVERDCIHTRLEEAEGRVRELVFAASEVERLHRENYELQTSNEQLKLGLTAIERLVLEKDSELSTQAAESDSLRSENTDLSERLLSSLAVQKAHESDILNERDQRRRLAGLLSAAQAKECQLQTEIGDLTGELADYAILQERHEDLLKALDRLMRTADLAEEDVNQLAQINAELVGHNNPSQKIRHLDKLRNELAGLKKVSRLCFRSKNFQ